MKKILKQNVGIDVSKDKIDFNFSYLTDEYDIVCKVHKQLSNNLKGFESFLTRVESAKEQNISITFTIEFTGVYYENLAYFLKEHGHIVYMVIPSKAKKFQESMSKCSKTDQLDAQVLAIMGLERKMKQWEPISPEFRKIRSLTREREQLLDEKQIVKNRLHAEEHSAYPEDNSVNRYKDRLTFIGGQIEEVMSDLTELIESQGKLSERMSKIMTLPGVGFITIVTVLAETNGFASIVNQKQLISYAGYDIKYNQSGKHNGRTTISKQGNSHIRRILYLPSQCARKYNQNLGEFYDRINDRNSKKMIAGVAVQRKLLCLIFALWKNDTVYDPNYNGRKQNKSDLNGKETIASE